MENAKKGQVNEISAGTLDGGIRFYKLPRLIFDALGVKPTFAEIILGFAKFADGVKIAKARESLQPDDQRLRLIRAGKLSDENIVDLFDVLLTSKRTLLLKQPKCRTKLPIRRYTRFFACSQ